MKTAALKSPLILILLGILLALILSLYKSAKTDNTPHSSPRIKVKDGLSSNWSGYSALTNLTSPSSNSVTDVKGSWVIPTVLCTSLNTNSSIWVGIDGYSDNTVEQTGTEQDCSSGSPKYYAWFEMYPKFPSRINMAVKPGDSISAGVKFAGNNRYTLTLRNNTTGASFSTTQKLNSAQRQSAEWIVEAPSSSGGVLPLANFGTANISGAQATINGVAGAINNPIWQNDPLTMITSSGTVKAAPSALSSDGSSFSVAWSSN